MTLVKIKNANGRHIPTSLSEDKQGEAMQELILTRPGFLVRRGISIFFLVLLFSVGICWFVQYPDIVTARAKLCAINSPKEVKINVDGRLVHLFVREGQSAQSGDMLGFIESLANHEEVLQLSKELSELSQLLNKNEMARLASFSLNQFQNLGELQPDLQFFTEQFMHFKSYLPNGFYEQSKNMIEKDIEYLNAQNLQFESQKALQMEELNISKLNFETNQRLHADQVISTMEFRNEQSKILNKQLAIPSINTSIIVNESQKNGKLREIVTLEHEIRQQKDKFSQLVNTLMSKVWEWKKKYILIAPIDGEVIFTTFFQENQQLYSNQLFCYINPPNSQYFAEVVVPQSNLGKIEQGQTVFLKFSAYPSQEFGSLKGNIEMITKVASDSGFIAKVALTNGLKTNYSKQLLYRNGLEARAEIITKNMRLIERFYLKTGCF